MHTKFRVSCRIKSDQFRETTNSEAHRLHSIFQKWNEINIETDSGALKALEMIVCG